MTLPILRSSGDLYHHFNQELRCLKRAMLTFRDLPPVNGTDTPLTPEQLEARVQATLRDYRRECGDYVPLIGIVSPAKEDTGYWHIHILLQRHNRSEEKPLTDEALLTKLARKRWLVFKMSNHPKLQNSDDETDLSEYVSNHMERKGAKVLTGLGVRTNFTKDRSLTGEQRRAAAPAEETVERRARPTPTPQELARKQRAAEQRTRPVYRPRRTPAVVLKAGERRAIRGYVVRTLPKSKSNQLPERARVILRKGKFNDTRRRR
jgi:hypothetical protein